MEETQYIAGKGTPSQEAIEPAAAADAEKCGIGDQPNMRVESDLPDRLPVTRELLDILERYFGDITDEVLGGGRL